MGRIPAQQSAPDSPGPQQAAPVKDSVWNVECCRAAEGSSSTRKKTCFSFPCFVFDEKYGICSLLFYTVFPRTAWHRTHLPIQSGNQSGITLEM